MEKKSVRESGSVKPRKWIVARAREDPFFVGKALVEYETVHDIDDRQLAGWLECNPLALARLALCRMPDNTEEDFQQQVRQISEFVPCNADRLVQLVREVAAFSALREGAHDTSTGLLLAARDRKGDNLPTKETLENKK